jgi:hypothetical protein
MVGERMIPAIMAFLSAIGEPLATWMSNRQKLNAEKFLTKMEIEKNKQRLAADKASYNHDWEMANLADKDKALRWISFILFSLPFVIAMFAPEHVKNYFDTSLNAIPVWWEKTYMGMMAGIWGISSLKNALPAIVDGLPKPKRTINIVKKDG